MYHLSTGCTQELMTILRIIQSLLLLILQGSKLIFAFQHHHESQSLGILNNLKSKVEL